MCNLRIVIGAGPRRCNQMVAPGITIVTGPCHTSAEHVEEAMNEITHEPDEEFGGAGLRWRPERPRASRASVITGRMSQPGALRASVRSDAEDAAQEILLKVTTKLSGFERRSTFPHLDSPDRR